MSTEFNVTTSTLEKLSLYTQQIVNQDTIVGAGHPAAVEIVADIIKRQLRIQLRKDLWSKTIDEIHISYPTDWWQSFKARWFPIWLKRKTPIKYTHVDKQLKAVFPDLALSDKRFANVYLYIDKVVEPTGNTVLVLTKEQKYQLLNILLGYKILCYTNEEKSICDNFAKQLAE